MVTSVFLLQNLRNNKIFISIACVQADILLINAP